MDPSRYGVKISRTCPSNEAIQLASGASVYSVTSPSLPAMTVARWIDQVLGPSTSSRKHGEDLGTKHVAQPDGLCIVGGERPLGFCQDAGAHPAEGLATQAGERVRQQVSADAPCQSELAVDDGRREVERAVDVH